jgi:hypothetical protein
MELMKITHHCHRLVKNDRLVLSFSWRAPPSPTTRPFSPPSRPDLLMLAVAAAGRRHRCCASGVGDGGEADGRGGGGRRCAAGVPAPRRSAAHGDHGRGRQHDPCGAAGKQVACGAVSAASSSSAQFPLLPAGHACARRLRMPVIPGAFGLWLDGFGQT